MKNLLKITLPVIAVIILASMLPRLIPCVDSSRFTGDYRIPYSMGEDYFLYEKYVETVARSGRIAVIGDSVIWGHYTDESGSLSAHLNTASVRGSFANMGIDGIHPAALYGLIENYCGSLRNTRVVVGINLLWMSSPRHDLSGEVNNSINHRALLPQYPGLVPAYSPPVEERLTFAAHREIVLFAWIDHMRASRFADRSLFRWTMDNPYGHPADYLAGRDEIFTPPLPLQPERMTGRDMEWVNPDRSLQWRYMLASVRKLKGRGNRVIAVITPFNQFMLTEKSRVQRDRIISEIREQLAADGVVSIAPVLYGAADYADLSHPVADGYADMALQLVNNAEFAEFVK